MPLWQRARTARLVRPVEAEKNAVNAFEEPLRDGGRPLNKEEGADGEAALNGDTRADAGSSNGPVGGRDRFGRRLSEGPWLSILEGIINSTVVMHMECSPYGVLHGREPRTRAAALADWSAGTFGVETPGISGATLDDINQIVAQYHAVVRAVQKRVILGSSV